MADLLSVLQGNAQGPAPGWGSLGAALVGGNREDAYNRGMARAAQLDQLVQTARFSREKAMEAEDARRGRGNFAQSAAAAGIPVAQASLLSDAFAAGYDPTKLSGYVGQNQEQDFRQNIVAQALAGNLPAAGAYSMGLAKGPLEMTKITDGTGYNPYLQADQQYYTTPVGQSTIGQRNAAAAASFASANSSNATAAATRGRLGIAQQQFDLQRQGLWNPSGAAAAGVASASGGPGGGVKMSSDELKQSFAGKALAEDAYDFAAAYLGKTPEQVRQMSPEDIRAAVAKGGRFTAGPLIGRLPGLNITANSDLDAYTSSAAGRQARINNPSGPVTDADFKAAERSVFSSTKPASVNADLIYRALMRGAGQSAQAGGAAPMQPAATIRPTTGQAPAIGTVRNGYRFLGGNPADPSSWGKN